MMVAISAACTVPVQAQTSVKAMPVTQPKQPGHIRIATFNVSMNRSADGGLLKDLVDNNEQIRKVASIIRLNRPDIVLLNEFDYHPKNSGVIYFADEYLNADRSDVLSDPIHYPHVWSGPVNTGVASNLDLNKNGKTDDAADSFGYGEFPGQYGMVVLSKFPILKSEIRTFQNLLWNQMPNAATPVDPETNRPWYGKGVWEKLRLSSKSHWDIPIKLAGSTLHVLASHPTPPAFDGPEDRNGCRNHDEIRFWADYISDENADWITDDFGGQGGIKADQPFVILGDLNSDPVDGNSHQQAILQLLKHPKVNSENVPVSEGAVEATHLQQKANLTQLGNPASDTADFSDGSVGNLRVDYVLPSRQLGVVDSGVFWPLKQHPYSKLLDCSDHRLVWLDVAVLSQ